MQLVLPAAPRYPWLLGTTSFVLPAGVEDNVQALAGQVDCVQLLFFESQSRSLLEHKVDVDILAGLAADHDLAYTIHLPLDLQLGSNDSQIRQQGVDEVCRLVEELAPLQARALDLHLDFEPDLAPGQWQDNVSSSLSAITSRIGSWRERLAVENIGYDFSLAAQVVQEAGLGICVDFGHRLRYNEATDFWALPNWRHIHLHGVEAGKDHQAFANKDEGFLEKLARRLSDKDYQGVVTLELYDAAALASSLTVLHQAWSFFTEGE